VRALISEIFCRQTRSCARLRSLRPELQARDLANADLTGANLKDANFHDARLTNARSAVPT